MTTPQLSVLLPCRNGARTLELALRSVLTQTFSNFEVLILNDGSTDATIEVASSFADSRVRLLGDRVGRGLPIRLNEGVAAARGRYIARMDADDVCFPARFEKQLAFLQSHPDVDLVGCRAVVFRDDGQVIGLLPYAPDHAALCARPWRNIPLPHPTWMGRKKWFLEHPYRLPEVHRAEDQELLLRSYPDSQYACLDEVLLGYRQGAFQLQRTLTARRSLLATQIGLFTQRSQWGYAVHALTLTAAKVVLDILAALPSFERLYFQRMSEPVPDLVKNRLQRCLMAPDNTNR